ncbi:MAG: acyl carrier protein [Caldilineae bacterium]|nr:MAG: acyl carrier protein [Caldilineae bacterium]
MEEVKSRIRTFLKQYIQHDLSDEEDIFAAGFVNSLFAMQLVLFVEDTFGLKVESEDLNLDNFRSINALANLVVRKMPAPSPDGGTA